MFASSLLFICWLYAGYTRTSQ